MIIAVDAAITYIAMEWFIVKFSITFGTEITIDL